MLLVGLAVGVLAAVMGVVQAHFRPEFINRLDDIVVFPHMIVPLFVGREKSIKALEAAAGRVLVERSTPVRATAAGTGVVRTARQMVLLEDEARAALGEGSDAPVALRLERHAAERLIGALHHVVGEADDGRVGAVVAHEAHRARPRVVAGEAQQVLGGGAGEGVDGLGDVTDDAQLAAPAQPQVQQALLERGDVLVLVDDEVAVLLTDRGGDVVALLEDADREQQDVLEVDDAARGLDVLVGIEQSRHRRDVEIGGLTSGAPCCRT